MHNSRLKPIILALVCVFFATASHSAETVKPKAAPSPENRISPSMGFEESKAHRESMKTYADLWTITVALTTRNARNPQVLSKEWQQRILEAAGVSLEYVGVVGGGDTHTFKPTKKITHAEAEAIAARIRTLPGILFAEPPPLEMGFNLAVPAVAPSPQNRLSPSMNSDEIKAHREYMKTYEHFWTITVALTSRNARNPQPLSNDWQRRIIEAAGIQLEYTQGASGDEHIFTPLKKITHSEAEEIAARIRTLPGILFAEPPPIGMSFNLVVATDPLYSAQWNLKGDTGLGGANLPPAWDIITGKNTMVVAVIDSGVLPSHPELSGRLLPGYDFITNSVRANDLSEFEAGGRDATPTDPGNWVTAAQATGGCKEAPSNWHGTRVASIIAANTNNGVGMAGVDWQTKVVPIRVTGKCVAPDGVYHETDMRDAIRWAAGLTVAGAPINANPAKVINISAGGPNACSPAIQTAINDARTIGAVIVAAVGNSAQVGAFSPANCNGVIRVAAVDSRGGLASYSNRGETASLSAPGGDYTDRPLYTAGDGGTTVALNNGVVTGEQLGTSFATPHVAGVAALMLALKPEMSPQQVQQCLLNTTRNFPTGTSFDCDNITCGTGILDAGQAISGARSTVSAGGYHTVTAQADGSVVTWGRNSYGQLGGGESLSLARPYPGAPLPGLSDVRDVDAGIWHTLALKGDGTVWGWGYNAQGVVGNGTTTTPIATPVQASGLTNAIAIASGDRHSLALRADGTVWAWGLNASGQLGTGNFTNSSVPVQVSSLTDVVAIAAGGKRSMALKKDGSVWAWGVNANATSDTSATVSAVPVQVPGLVDIVAIAAGGNTTGGTGVESDTSLALTWDGKVYAWGYNNWGQLCQGDTVSKFLPKLVPLTQPAVKIDTSEAQTLMLLEDSSLLGCGDNSGGALGDGTTTTRKSPSLAGSGTGKVLDVVTGRDFSLGLSSNLSVQSWGWNSYGQLGDGTSGTTANRLLPTQVRGAGNVGFYNTRYATSTSADMGIVLSDSPDPALADTNLTYDLQLINYGPDTATGVSAVLSLPSQATFVSATTGCSYANASVTCTLTSLNSAANAAFQVVVKPTAAATLNATASVSSGIHDPATSNNVAGTSTVANAAAPTDGDVPLPAWALILLGAGLLETLRGHQLRQALSEY